MRVFRAGSGLALAAALGATLTGCPREAAESKQAPRSLPVPVFNRRNSKTYRRKAKIACAFRHAC